MEQIIIAILVMLVSGIIAAVKEKAAKRQSRDIHAVVSAPARSRNAAPAAPAAPARSSIPAPPLPEEGLRVTSAAPQMPPLPESAADPDIAAHRERWRRAFIDSEILARKF